MFIKNFKIGKNKFSKILIFTSVVLVIFLLIFSIRSIFDSSVEEGQLVEEQDNQNIIEITS